MSEGDPNDPRSQRSKRLAQDLFLEDEDEGRGTVPDLEVRRVHAARQIDPPTVPIDVSGYQELPLPDLSYPTKESSGRQSMSAPPAPRPSAIRTLPQPSISSTTMLGPPPAPRPSVLQGISAQPIAPQPSQPPIQTQQPQPQSQLQSPSLSQTMPIARAPREPVITEPMFARYPSDPSIAALRPGDLSISGNAPISGIRTLDPGIVPRAQQPTTPQRPIDPPPPAQEAPLPPTIPTFTSFPGASAPAPQVSLAAPPRAPLARPLNVALPAAVLVIDDDTRAGSTIASRLLELGYTARVVKWADAKAAVTETAYNAIVGEIPADETRIDAGRGRIDPLIPIDAPIILTSSAVFRVDLLRELPPVAAALTKPFFVEVLVSSIETARMKAPRPSPRQRTPHYPDEDLQTQPLPSAHFHAAVAEPEVLPLTDTVGERRMAERFELDINIVRALISGGPDGQAVRGRVRNLSIAGGILIDTASRLVAKTLISAELTTYDGRVMLFNGRVIRQSKNELALKLDADEAQRGFLGRFLDDARATDGRAVPPVRINVKEETNAALDDVALMKRWLEVCDLLDDDPAQQRFIQDCLRAERIEFAIARYRDRKNANPDDERVAKYLLQLGTILSFKVLSKKEVTSEPQKMPNSLKMVIGFFVLAGFALLLIMLKVLKK